MHNDKKINSPETDNNPKHEPITKKSLKIRKSDRAERRNWQIYNYNPEQ